LDSFTKRVLSSDMQLVQEILVDVKDQLDDHLTAINENTSEIQANFEYIVALNSNIEKLSERIEKIEMFMQNHGFEARHENEFNPSPLTKNEQEVFLALYTLDESKGFVTYADIAKRLCLSEDLVAQYIASMMAKHVPIDKRYANNKAYIKLNQSFKALQAKHNILKISQKMIPEVI